MVAQQILVLLVRVRILVKQQHYHFLQMKTLQEFIKESLLQHIVLELKDEDIIYERYGVYDGCNELINFIINKIDGDENLIIQYNEVKHLKNIVFDVLHINLTKSSFSNTNYKIYNDENNINPDAKRFYKVHLEIFYLNKIDLKSLLSHELTHIFNDYKIQCLGYKTFFDIFNTEEYKLSKQFINKNIPVNFRQFCRALYLLNDYEKNAFIAQISNEIDEIKKNYKDKNIKNANEIYFIIKETQIYKAYEEVGKFIDLFYKNELSENICERIISEWKRIKNINHITINQIFKELKNKFIKTKNKIESLIPKKIAENNIVVLDNINTICIE